MVLRRSDARRRRMVIDPTVPADDVAADNAQSITTKRSKKKPTVKKPDDVRAYSYGADRRNQLKTTDLIPKRVLSYMLVLMAMLLSIAFINFCSIHASQWSAQVGEAGMSTLAIQGQGSLASWYSSFLLIISGMASIQIYALRQHRCDDYRGTYRLWIWMAILFLLASVNCVVDLGGLATNLVQAFTSQSFSDRPWLPITIKLTALSLLVARGLYEVRKSRGSFALVVVVWVAYSVAAVMQLPAAKESLVNLGSEKVMGNCILFGTSALLLAHLTYARFIFLRAHGLITVKVKTKRAKKKKTKVPPKKKATTKTATTKTAATKTTKAKSTRSKPNKSAAAKTKSKSKTSESETDSQKSKSTKVAASTSKRATKSTAKSKPAATSQANKKTTKPASTASKKTGKAEEKSPSELLKELAAASRAKAAAESAKTSAKTTTSQQDDESGESIIKMSKSQRRKSRKQNKQQRRAA